MKNKFESEKHSLAEIINQKKDLNETLINLEKQVINSGITIQNFIFIKNT